jgi:hypothetical protein
MALANRSFILFSLLTQQTRWISSTQKWRKPGRCYEIALADLSFSLCSHNNNNTTTKRYGLPFQQRQGGKKIFSSQDGLPNQQSRCWDLAS